MQNSLFYFTLFCVLILETTATKYNATWESLNSRPIPTWWLEDKVGIFIHMGVFSVPAYRCNQEPGPGPLSAEWYWDYLDGSNYSCIQDYHTLTFGSNFAYQDFVFDYKLNLFNASFWADLFYESGAKWVVFTSKHHEGYVFFFFFFFFLKKKN